METKVNEAAEGEFTIPHTMALKYPIPFGKDEQITELVFERRLIAEDMMQLPVQGQVLGDTFKLISKMTRQPMSVIKKLDAEDIMEAGKVVNSFLPSGPETE
jgi:hypothetical protein